MKKKAFYMKPQTKVVAMNTENVITASGTDAKLQGYDKGSTSTWADED